MKSKGLLNSTTCSNSVAFLARQICRNSENLKAFVMTRDFMLGQASPYTNLLKFCLLVFQHMAVVSERFSETTLLDDRFFIPKIPLKHVG